MALASCDHTQGKAVLLPLGNAAVMSLGGDGRGRGDWGRDGGGGETACWWNRGRYRRWGQGGASPVLGSGCGDGMQMRMS